MLSRYESGETQVWSVVRVPSKEQEDELRLHREMNRLKKERGAHGARIKSLLILHGIKLKASPYRLGEQLDAGLRCWDEKPLPEALREELRRELDRYIMQVHEQIRLLEKAKAEALKNPTSRSDEKAKALLRLRGVGEVSAWVLGKEFFGWREFRNRREVAALAGLVPSPYNSGDSVVEQGISKAGTPRIRRTRVELAWCWLKFQPERELTIWFLERYAKGSGRQRRVGIVARARKLLVALWKYVEFGTVPEGAIIH